MAARAAFIPSEQKTIVFAAIVSLASLQLYVRCAPYIDEGVDLLSTLAQLMTFTQLFVALLISASVPRNPEPVRMPHVGFFASRADGAP